MRLFGAGLLVMVLCTGALTTGAHAQASHPIIVQSPTMQTGQMMPRDYAPDGRNLSPPLTWSNLPEGTREIAVICQDHGARLSASVGPLGDLQYSWKCRRTARGSPIRFHAVHAGGDSLGQCRETTDGAWRCIAARHLPSAASTTTTSWSMRWMKSSIYPLALLGTELLEAIDGHVIGQGDIMPVYQRIQMPDPSGNPRHPIPVIRAESAQRRECG